MVQAICRSTHVPEYTRVNGFAPHRQGDAVRFERVCHSQNILAKIHCAEPLGDDRIAFVHENFKKRMI
jgi:hypothetical protein